MAIDPAVSPILTDTSGTSRLESRTCQKKSSNAAHRKLTRNREERRVMPVTPMIAYEDGVAALEWLSRAFEFKELRRMIGDGGRLAHGEMETGDGVIMLATPSPHYEGPKHHREH